ncbi:hypothetical protein AAFC00_005044 [Neodothiora populina]|uniref:Short-chain dehydrogenase n=1 Tax=Neodothiora populina TaxID=2781224 RepID=A0ABR3PJK9_9PEZI
MSSSLPVMLILGAGANIGANVAQTFAANGYKVVLTSRTAVKGDDDSAYTHIQGDLSKPDTVADIFARVRTLAGEPSMVVYNAAAAMTTKEDPFAISLETFQQHLDINTTSVFSAIKETLVSFASPTLPATASRTFIYTGNALNTIQMPALLTLGVGKSASAHLIACAASAYGPKGYKFYYTDERRLDGSVAGQGISGEAHAELYDTLAKAKAQGPWLQTFVKDHGYVDFASKQ